MVVFRFMILLTKHWDNLFSSSLCTSFHQISMSQRMNWILFFLNRASTLLCLTAEQNFPYMTKEIPIQISYVKNLLRASSYLTHQRLGFLELIVSRLLRLDVNRLYMADRYWKFFFKFRFTHRVTKSWNEKLRVLKTNSSSLSNS